MQISKLLFACALALSGVAAYYSIVGLATIFSSAFLPVIIMAGILEISKLVVASWLYKKWHEITLLIKVYLTSAVVILMLITSLGIFGFLSKAHVEQTVANREISLRINQLDFQISSATETINRYQTQLSQLDRAINIHIDANRPTQALNARRSQQSERDQIRTRIDAEQESIIQLNQQKSRLQSQLSSLESEVGPIRYVAEFFVGDAVDLEKSVRWMIIIIVLVFDPLAILMLIAANMRASKEEQDKNTIPSIIDSPRGPASGDVIFVQNIPFRWWDGTSWQKIDEFSDIYYRHINENSNPTLDLNNEIKEIVHSAMDSWLTNTVSDTKSNNIPNNDANISGDSINNINEDIKTSPINSKPSWL